ncbi:NAD(P)-dependent oxidoreductase [Actinopolymorpha pittospori]|uniref:Phosphoglycerate dehydrogenase-like enzyme n=1 Tax=Actinopolymorpha pittospori TaxID=648752 RepID=A0A927N2M8_9ACTN|nr:NAD(P)-dependent oxidoreductase [Actinopolymorpha pittospori]MBE1607480.1 phosphoglycerate dehydrogenase-like enzyme [Actinopolymorpha pittospori]
MSEPSATSGPVVAGTPEEPGGSAAPGKRPVVGVACDAEVREHYLAPDDLARLTAIADVRYADFTGLRSVAAQPPPDADSEAELAKFAAGLDALVVCHGAPRVTERVLAAAPGLAMVGELEGDRFAGRVDVDAADRYGVLVVDTTHGSSYPVAEWALALMVLGMRDVGRWKRRTELTGKRVGLIGFGHIAWRLVELVRPYGVEVLVHDPYSPRELADALGVTFAPLDAVLAGTDVVVCLAPLTPRTRGLLGARELGLLAPGTVFVNVSRGAIVDSVALLARLRRGDVVACLDVHDPEPVPPDAEIRALPNVFLSPHVAGTTVESRTRFFGLMVEEIERLFRGTEPRALLTRRVVAIRDGLAQPGGAA